MMKLPYLMNFLHAIGNLNVSYKLVELLIVLFIAEVVEEAAETTSEDQAVEVVVE